MDGTQEGKAAEMDVPPPRKPSPPTRTEPSDRKALERQVGSREARWLETADGDSFLALELPHRTPEQQGAVLLLHGQDAHPAWPEVLGPLRELLPDDGWSTLGVSLPYQPIRDVPKREQPVKNTDHISMDAPRTAADMALQGSEADAPAPDEAAAEAENKAAEGAETAPPEAEAKADKETSGSDPAPSGEEAGGTSGESKGVIDVSMADAQSAVENAAPAIPEKSPHERALQRLQASVSHLKGRGQENLVLLALGTGADELFRYLKQTGGVLPSQGGAIVLIDPVFSDEFRFDFQSALSEGFEFPILEVVDSRDALKLADAKARMGSARRAKLNGYQQIRFPLGDLRSGEVSLLTQRVRGWLKRHAPGFERKGR